MIEFVHLKKSFGKPVLVDVNLQVEHGETMVVIGRSGCGKSVLLKHIIGLLKPDEGALMIDGQDVTRLKGTALDEIRKRFGFLFQASALFDSMTVGENVGAGLTIHSGKTEEEINERVRECLRMVGLKGIEELKPAELSGGMRKRVGLARAIAMNPEYILYDEPTTGLDPANQRRIGELIRSLQQRLGVTSVIVTHELELCFAISDRVGLIKNGRIVAVGSAEEMRRSDHPDVRAFLAGEHAT